MTERIARMAEYVKTHDIYPEKVPVEYDKYDLLLPDCIMDAKRISAYMAAQTVKITDDDRMVGLIMFDGSTKGDLFWRTGHKRFAEINAAFYKQPQENLSTFEAQHSTADFSFVIQFGMEGYLKKIREAREVWKDEPERLEFLDAMEIVVHGILAWAEKCAAACEEKAKEAEGALRDELLEMSRIMRRVPRYPAEHFREAVQCLYFCFHFLPDSVGTMDRYLYPTYRKDTESGLITREQAKELLQELCIMVNGHTVFSNTWSGDKGGESHFAIGGYGPDHADCFSDLSRLIVEAMMDVPLYRPQVSLRWTPDTPREVLYFMLDCERHDAYKRIAVVNDVPRIKSFMENCGLSYEEACNYTMVGCNEPALQGSLWYGGVSCNAVRCLDRLLHDMRDEVLACAGFEEVYALFEREFGKDLKRMLFFSDGFNRGRAKDANVLSTLFINGSVERAKSVTQGGTNTALAGITIQGIICLIDSLTVIRQFVFEEKSVSMRELLDALRDDWKGHEDLRVMILRRARFFGNDDPLSNEMARRVTTMIHDLLSRERNLFGFPFLVGTLSGYVPHYAMFGALTRATPDGRAAGDAFMVGVGQTAGKDREGLTAMLNSVAQMDPTGILAGPFVLNVSLDEVLIRKDEYFDRMIDVIETYFRRGGLHVQLNYVSREELLDAQSHPEKYESLRVRVSGFSGYFTRLDRRIQDDIIRRTIKKG